MSDGNHDVCSIHHLRINEASEAVCQAVNRLGIEPYNEKTGKGALRYIQLTAAGGEASGRRAEQDPLATVQASPHHIPPACCLLLRPHDPFIVFWTDILASFKPV